jgi:3alpha(or 20beta)-hydroxysteroid dehydrogenase
MPVGRLDGKVGLVTGAARGQGAAISRRFASEGAKVVLADVLDEGEVVAKEIGGAARFVHHDVGAPESWRQAVDAATDAFGKLDVLVNNAGILRPARLVDQTLEDYMLQVRVNQAGCFLGMQAVVGPMAEAGGGAIVNTSSTSGLEGMPNIIGYGATKHAVIGMTKTAAIELGRYGIRVNAIAPGGVDTPMTRLPEFADMNMDDFFKHQPIRRIGTPEEIAGIVLYLASDEASYVTGAVFVIDGGALAGTKVQGV